MTKVEDIFSPGTAPFVKWLLHVGSVLVVVFGFLWNCSGPIIDVYAKDIFEKKLIELGVNPRVIAEMKTQGERNGVNITDLHTNADQIRRDIQAVKDQTRSISAKQDAMAQQNTRIEGQLDRVLDTLLNRDPRQ